MQSPKSEMLSGMWCGVIDSFRVDSMQLESLLSIQLLHEIDILSMIMAFRKLTRQQHYDIIIFTSPNETQVTNNIMILCMNVLLFMHVYLRIHFVPRQW